MISWILQVGSVMLETVDTTKCTCRSQTVLMKGAAQAPLLCARLYATRLKDYGKAEEVATGLLAIPLEGDGKGFGNCPLSRIETWRLLARCRGARGDAAGACEALEHAVRESEEVGYVWMQAEALRDMLEWADCSQHVRERVAAVASRFPTDYSSSGDI